MGCVIVFVVLVIIGNVGSFVINRTNTDLDINILKSIWGSSSPPSGDQDSKTASEDGSHSAATLNTKNVFGSPEVPSETMTVTESSLASNDTGSTIDYQDRFLSEKILKNKWQFLSENILEGNYVTYNVSAKEKPASTITPRLATMPSDNSAPQPEQHGTPSTGHQKPEQQTIPPKEHTLTLVPSSGKNTSSKHIPRSLLVFLLSIVLCK